MQLFIYNYFIRHIFNVLIYWSWYLEKRTFSNVPLCGKISNEAIEWANKIILEK